MSTTTSTLTTPATARGQSEADSLTDLKAMYAAAEADPDVKARLGAKYLSETKDDIDHAEALIAGKGSIQHDKLATGASVAQLAESLLVVMQDIRDMAADDVDAVTAKSLGRGADWKASSVGPLVADARTMATFLHNHPSVAKTIHLDAQHAHDLAHLATAIDDARGSHTQLVSARKSDTHARDLLMATLRARAHHIRVRARIAHRHDPEKLAPFESPVAHHKVVHHAKPATTPIS